MDSLATTTTPTNDLTRQLAHIGLHATAAGCDDFIARATKSRWSPRTMLEEIARGEMGERARRGLERRLTRARLGRFKPIADFDWNWPTKIERDAIERALTGEFIREGRNFILIGTNGLGKTMISKNIGHAAILAGHSVLFRTAAELLDDLQVDSPELRRRRLAHYARPSLLRRRLRAAASQGARARGPLRGDQRPLRAGLGPRHQQPRLHRMAGGVWGQPAARLGRARPPRASSASHHHHRPQLPGARTRDQRPEGCVADQGQTGKRRRTTAHPCRWLPIRRNHVATFRRQLTARSERSERSRQAACYAHGHRRGSLRLQFGGRPRRVTWRWECGFHWAMSELPGLAAGAAG